MKKWYLLCVLTAVLTHSFVNAQSIAKFHPGLYVILRADSAIQFTNSTGDNLSIPTRKYIADSSQNYIDGYMLQLFWNTMTISTSGSNVTSITVKNPTSGQGRSFIELDSLFKMIQRRHKFAAIGLAGSYNAPKVKRFQNLVVENDRQSGGPCLDSGNYILSNNSAVRLDTFPLPWDTAYEHQYKKVISQLQQYLVSHHDSISYINFGPITTTADEFRLPNDIFCINSLNIHENDFIKWHNIGYYDTKKPDSIPFVNEAFKYFVDSVYGSSFPNATLWVGAMRTGSALPNIPKRTPPKDGTDCSNPQMTNFYSCVNGPYLDHTMENGSYDFSDLMYDNLETAVKDPKAPTLMIANTYLDQGYDQTLSEDYVHMYNNYRGMNNTALCGTYKGNELAQTIFQPGDDVGYQDSLQSKSFASRIGAALFSGANVGTQVLQIWPFDAYMAAHGATQAIRDTVQKGLTRASYALKYLSPYADGTPRKFSIICKVSTKNTDTFSIAGAPTSLLFGGISWTVNDKTSHSTSVLMGQKVVASVINGHLYTVTLAYNNACGAVLEDTSLCVTGSAPISGVSQFSNYWCSYDTLHPMRLGNDSIPNAVYTWTPSSNLNNAQIARPQILFKTPGGTYTFNEQIQLGTCQGTDTEVVTVQAYCCHSDTSISINNGNDSLLLTALGQSYSPYHNQLKNLQTQVFINGPFYVLHPLTISHIGNNIKFGPKSAVIVQSYGDTLTLDSIRLNGCALKHGMWSGIKNIGNYSGVIADSSQFANADTAILSTNNSVLTLNTCRFINNWESLVLEHYSNGSRYINITGCSFDVPRVKGLQYPHAGARRGLYGIYLSNVFSYTLGVDNAAVAPNTFRRMQYGIYSDTSKYSIYRATITHCGTGIYANGGIPKGTSFNPPNMALQVGSTDAGSGVQMSTCQNGIIFSLTDGSVFNSSLNINSDSTAYGVLFTNGYNNSCIVKNTTIGGQLNYGVDFLGNNTSSYLTVANDSIKYLADSVSVDTSSFYGVNVGGVSSQSDFAKDTIQSNYINISNTGLSPVMYNRYGIYTTNKGGGLIVNNNLVSFQSNPNYIQYGIRLENVGSAQVTGNTIAGTQITPTSAAISIVSSPRAVITCNKMSFTKSGIEFIGDDNDYTNSFRLAGNTFANHYDAIKLGDSLLGPGYINSMMTYTCGTSKVVPTNQFSNISNYGLHCFQADKKNLIYYYYNTKSGGNVVKPTIQNELPNQGFADSSQSSTPLFDCSMTCVLTANLKEPIDPATTSSEDENLENQSVLQAVNGEVNFSNHNTYMQYALKNEAYNDLQQMSAMNLSNELKFFSDTTSRDNIGKFYQLAQIIQKRNDYGKLDSYAEQLREQAESLNASIDASSIYEKNQVQVNDVYLSTFAKAVNKLSAPQMITLKNIAYQCPFDGGNAVFEARGLLAAIGFAPMYNDDKLCQSFADEQVANDNIIHSAFSLTPNPSSERVTLNYYLKDNELMNYYIMNDLGKMIENGKISSSATSQAFDVSDFVPGIYFVKIASADGKENYNLKMTVTR